MERTPADHAGGGTDRPSTLPARSDADTDRAARTDTADGTAADAGQSGRGGRGSKPITCVACGYDVAGLDPRGRCPECGTPIAEAMGGRHIALSGARWIATAAAGARLLGWSVALWPLSVAIVVVCALGGLISGAGVVEVLWWRWPWLLGGVVACELVLGWWFMTPAERLGDGAEVRGRWSLCRRATRALSACAAALVVCAAGATLVGRDALLERMSGLWAADHRWLLDAGVAMLGAGATVCMVGAHLFGMRYAARLAGRARRWSLHRRLKRLARMPVQLVCFYVGAWVLLPFVALADLILGLLPLIYLAAVNLVTPGVLVGIMVASGRGLLVLSRELGASASAARGVRGGRSACGVRAAGVGRAG